MKAFKKFRYILIFLALIAAVSGLREAAISLTSRFAYRKDLLQFYLQARAVREGADPYVPMPQLAQQLQVEIPSGGFQHPAPHPPILAILCLPLTLFKFEAAGALWVIAQYLCLVASTELLLRWWRGQPSYLWSALVALIVVKVGPVWEDIVYGQVNIFQLLLFLLALWGIRGERQGAGGAALGAVIAIKYIGWPLLFLLAMRRRWRALTVAVLTLVVANLLAFAVVGWRVAMRYFLHVGPQVLALYQASVFNWSLWSLGWRLFDGTGSPALVGITAKPLIFAPLLVPIANFLIVAGALVTVLLAAHRTKRFEVAFGIVLSVSLLISPLMWPHYLLMMAISLFIAALDLRSLGFPRKPLLGSLVLVLILFLPREASFNAIKFFTLYRTPDGEIIVPFVATLISMIPTLSAVIAIYLCYRLAKTVELNKTAGP